MSFNPFSAFVMAMTRAFTFFCRAHSGSYTKLWCSAGHPLSDVLLWFQANKRTLNIWGCAGNSTYICTSDIQLLHIRPATKLSHIPTATHLFGCLSDFLDSFRLIESCISCFFSSMDSEGTGKQFFKSRILIQIRILGISNPS